DAEAVRATAEPAVGDERGVGAATGTLHRARDGKHLTHAGASLRAFVPDHHDVARLDLAGEDVGHGRVFAVEDTRGAVETHRVDACDLHHCTLRRQRTLDDRDATDRVDRCRQRVHDVGVGSRWVELFQVFGHRLAGHGETGAV